MAAGVDSTTSKLPLCVGDRIEAEWCAGQPWQKGTIEGINSLDETFSVLFDAGYRKVSMGHSSIRLLPKPLMLKCLESKEPLFFDVGTNLKVGRQVQPQSLWERLVPLEALRNTISREHFQVRMEGCSICTLKNLSSGGTLVNGALIRGECPLYPGDVIAIGTDPPAASPTEARPVLRFRLEGGSVELARRRVSSSLNGSASVMMHPQAAQGAQPLILNRTCGYLTGTQDTLPGGSSPSKPPLPAISQACFSLECAAVHGLTTAQVQAVSRNVRVYSTDGELKIGRTVQPASVWEAVVPDERLRNTISREHFKIVSRGAGAFELENSSAGGTLVNGKRVNGHGTCAMRTGDLVGIGAATPEGHPVLTLRFVGSADAAMEEYISGSSATLPNPIHSKRSSLPSVSGSAMTLPSASSFNSTANLGSSSTVAMPTSLYQGLDAKDIPCQDNLDELMSRAVNPSSTIQMPVSDQAKQVTEEIIAVDVGTITVADAQSAVSAAELPPAVYCALLPPDAVRGVVDISWMSSASLSQSQGIRVKETK